MSERRDLIVGGGEGRAASMLTDARFQQLAAVPAELEWFANLGNDRSTMQGRDGYWRWRGNLTGSLIGALTAARQGAGKRQ